MSNLEILHQMMRDFGEQNLTSEQEQVVLLTSIAQSLAVIADILTVQKKNKSSWINFPEELKDVFEDGEEK